VMIALANKVVNGTQATLRFVAARYHWRYKAEKVNRIFKLNISVLLLSFAFAGACFGEYLDGDSILDSAETLKERGEHDQAVKVLSDGLVALQQSNPTVENHK